MFLISMTMLLFHRKKVKQ